MWWCFACISVHQSLKRPEEGLDTLELGFKMVVICHVGALIQSRSFERTPVL